MVPWDAERGHGFIPIDAIDVDLHVGRGTHRALDVVQRDRMPCLGIADLGDHPSDYLVGTSVLPDEHVSQIRIVRIRGVERIDELVQLVLELVRHSGVVEILVAEVEDNSASLLVDDELLDLSVRGKAEADLPRAVVHAEAQVFGSVPIEEVVEHLSCGEGVLAILPDMDAVQEIVERHHGRVAELELVEYVLNHANDIRRIVVELADVERAVHEETVRFVHTHIEER